MTEIPDKPYFRPDEVATLICVPVRTVYHWIHHRKIRAIRVQKIIRIPREEVLRLTAMSRRIG